MRIVTVGKGLVMSIYSEMREETGRWSRINDDYKNVAMIWCKHAVVKRFMQDGLVVVETDPEHVKVFGVMDKCNAGIPTSGALCAKRTPPKFRTVSAASL